MEKTLILLKPDAFQRGLIGKIIARFEEKGLKIVGIKMLKVSSEKAKEHYAHLADKPFFPELEEYITHQPIIAMVLEGKQAIEVVRKLVGKTNGREAAPGTIRGDYSMSTSRNLIHASDSPETAEKEIKRFFEEDELFEYDLQLLKKYYYAGDEI